MSDKVSAEVRLRKLEARTRVIQRRLVKEVEKTHAAMMNLKEALKRWAQNRVAHE